MSYQTKLNPPPAKGWVPPPLPPLEKVMNDTQPLGEAKVTKKQNTAPTPSRTTGVAPRMANLFEEAPRTLFDAHEVGDPEPEPVPKPPMSIGPIMINGHSAQLVEKKALDTTRTQYKVILDSTGELKSFVSPPAIITL
jgi:hypothetical protein